MSYVDTKQVVMGPMNGPQDPHPVTIQSVCKILGMPLPADAVCGHQPSYYLKEDAFPGTVAFIRESLGKYMPDITDEDLKKYHRYFKRKYEVQITLESTLTDFTVYFCDWLLYARDRGFSHNDYFDYELYNKEPEIRDTFINRGFGIRLFNSCRSKAHGKYFREKALFNQTFAKYVHRDWLDMKSEETTFEDFAAFCAKHEKFFAKPAVGTGGNGARVITTDSDTLENLYSICKEEKMMVEELVQQHSSLAEFNEGSINTTRVVTLVCADGVPRILFAVVRFGRKGIVVDNFHGGGVGAIIDPETGVIISKAVNSLHEMLEEHPDSNKPFIGFQYPEWEKVKAAVLDAAMMIPEMRSIGWDVAVTKDGEVEFIEGNSKSGFHLPQEPDQTGKKYKYETYLKEIEELKGIKVKEFGPLKVIDPDAELKVEKKDKPKKKGRSIKKIVAKIIRKMKRA